MQVNGRLLIGIISFAVSMTGVILGNIFLMIMIGEINRKRQDGNLVSYFGFVGPKVLEIAAEYRRLYPRGKIAIYTWASAALAYIGMISVAVCLRIIR